MRFLSKHWYIILIIILISVITILAFNYSMPSNKITAKEAQTLIQNGATILDVRTYMEYKSGHIKHAKNIPYDEINETTINLDKSETIIVYCRSGSRSSKAAETLENMGYKHVYDVGSIDNWKQSLVKD